VHRDGIALIPTKQAAERLGVDVRTLHRYVAKRRIHPAIKVPGYKGAFLFAEDEVERLRIERTTAA